MKTKSFCKSFLRFGRLTGIIMTGLLIALLFTRSSYAQEYGEEPKTNLLYEDIKKWESENWTVSDNNAEIKGDAKGVIITPKLNLPSLANVFDMIYTENDQYSLNLGIFTLQFTSDYTGDGTASILVITDSNPEGEKLKDVSADDKTVSVSLKKYAGKAIRLAFQYDGDGDGWKISDIKVSGVPVIIFDNFRDWCFKKDENEMVIMPQHGWESDGDWYHYGNFAGAQLGIGGWHIKDGVDSFYPDENGSITSPPLELPANLYCTMSFYSDYDGETGASFVWIITDEHPDGVKLDFVVEDDEHEYDAPQQFSLSEYAGQTIRVKFTYDGSAEGEGWWIGDFYVWGEPIPVEKVAIAPAAATVKQGLMQKFTAEVTPAGALQDVVWSVTGGVAATAINEYGILTVAFNETAKELTVKVTSADDATKSAEAKVTVEAGTVSEEIVLYEDNFEEWWAGEDEVTEIQAGWESDGDWYYYGNNAGAQLGIGGSHEKDGVEGFYPEEKGTLTSPPFAIPYNAVECTLQFISDYDGVTGDAGIWIITDEHPEGVKSDVVIEDDEHEYDNPLVFDLLKYAGQSIRFRFEYDGTSGTGGEGWWIGDFVLKAKVIETSKVVSITVSPDAIDVQIGDTQQFTAEVEVIDAPDDIVWSVNSTTGSAIDADGLLTVSLVEAKPTLTVTATSLADGSVKGTATVRVTSKPVTSIAVTPATQNVEQGASLQFTAAALPAEASQVVVWSITGNTSAATVISASGKLTVGRDEPVNTEITVTATSNVTKTVSGEAKVKVLERSSVTGITIDPETASVLRGANERFVATVGTTGTASNEVTWKVSGTLSSIDANGVLTVRDTETATELTVTATSVFDGSKTATATVTIPTVTITVTAADGATSVRKGSALVFTATVAASGGATEAITWTVNSTTGSTVTPTDGKECTLTVAAGETAMSLTVTATSVDEPSKSDSKIVTVEEALPSGVNELASVEFSVYPNPTDGAILVQFETPAAYSITVSDISGKTLLNRRVSDQTVQIDLGAYPAGVYLLTVSDGKQQTTTKVVKK